MVSECPTVDVYAGDPMVVEYTMEDDGETGVDLSAWSFTCQWRKSRRASESIDLVVDDSGKAAGVVVIKATGEQTPPSALTEALQVTSTSTVKPPTLSVSLRPRRRRSSTASMPRR